MVVKILPELLIGKASINRLIVVPNKNKLCILILTKDFTKEHVKWNHPYDKTGRSKIDQIIFDLKNNTGSVVVSCYFWSKKIKNKENWGDSIRVELYTKKYADWLVKEAH